MMAGNDPASADAAATDAGSGLPARGPDFNEERHPETIDNAIPTVGYQTTPVVGLGGSAGSIAALRTFFDNTPPGAGLAYVVVLHLAPEHESSLPQLLQRHTRMPVRAAVDGDVLRPDHVYVIPPGQQLQAENGHLRLAELPREPGKRVAVDLFFRSLADTHGAHAAAIVLSGADGDGSIGLKRIKERGGLTIAQDPEEADIASMPSGAIATGMVDWILPVAEMPARVIAYLASERYLRLPPETGPQPAEPVEPAPDQPEALLREVLSFLRLRTGRDFSYYKRATIVRRISRRMQVNGVFDLSEYLLHLRTHPGEASALLQDLLISVTNFFRDREAFQSVEECIPDLFRDKKPTDSVRVWCPACATGEEPYSMAMLLLEHARTLEAPPTIQVFGCDLDDEAIQVARLGFYPGTISADVSEERLRRFFCKENGGWRVRRELREMVLFASHDLLKDAPFSRMDLISCRNLLIYLNRDAQRRALDLFHFALRPGALLFLGTSESVEEGSDLFATHNKQHRLFRQQPMHRVGLSVPGGNPNSALNRVIQQHDRLKNTGAMLPGRAFLAATVPGHPFRSVSEDRVLPGNELHYKLISRFGPASAVVDGRYDIVHLSENVNRFLHVPEGEPTRNLLRLVHPALRVDLHAALIRAQESMLPVTVSRDRVEFDGGPRSVDLQVAPAGELAPDALLVVFETREPGRRVGHADTDAQIPLQTSTVVQQLERELTRVNAQLRDTVEQFETSTEEFKASNEELQAMNEELRSAGEELETGREELQSVNEELTTVNAEFRNRVEELAKANSDLQNLMSATQIATVFLDRELQVMRYTPSAAPLFNLIPSDIGRPIAHLHRRLAYPELGSDAEQVLRTLVPTEREMRDDGHWFLARVLPYRTIDDRIGGVVLTFVDITERRQAEEALQQSRERLQLVLENASEYAIFTTDGKRRITSWNLGAEMILGYSSHEAIGQLCDMLFTAEDVAAGVPAHETGQALRTGRALDERWHVRKDGSLFWGSGVMTAIHDATGVPVGVVKIFRDQTAELHSKQALEHSRVQLHVALDQAQAADRAKDRFLAVLSHELRTPLTPLMLAAQMLTRDKSLPPHVLGALDIVLRNARLETLLVDDLLDITRIASGKMELHVRPTSVREIVGLAVDVSRPDLDVKEQKLTISLADEDDVLTGDVKRLQQAVWNLLKNASKFTPRGGAIEVVSRIAEKRAVIEVNDSGVGFAPEGVERIFTAFEQGSHAVTREFGGLGLGLAIARAGIEAHGGTIHASSPGPGKGATFTIELPLAH